MIWNQRPSKCAIRVQTSNIICYTIFVSKNLIVYSILFSSPIYGSTTWAWYLFYGEKAFLFWNKIRILKPTIFEVLLNFLARYILWFFSFHATKCGQIHQKISRNNSKTKEKFYINFKMLIYGCHGCLGNVNKQS